MTRALKYWTDRSVLWVVTFSAAAYAFPNFFTPLQRFIVVHNLTGSLMANIWSRSSEEIVQSQGKS